MPYNPAIHHRRSIRLQGYDYSRAGWYFITVCVKDRLHLFGDISNGEMILNDMGRVVSVSRFGNAIITNILSATNSN